MLRRDLRALRSSILMERTLRWEDGWWEWDKLDGTFARSSAEPFKQRWWDYEALHPLWSWYRTARSIRVSFEPECPHRAGPACDECRAGWPRWTRNRKRSPR